MTPTRTGAPAPGTGEPGALGSKAKGGGAVRPPGGKGLAAAAPAPPTDARAPAEGTAAVAFFAPAAASAAGAPAAPPAPGVGPAPDASAAEEPPWPPACCAAPFCLAATDWREERPPPPGRTSVPTVATRRTTAAATASATATGRRPPAEAMSAASTRRRRRRGRGAASVASVAVRRSSRAAGRGLGESIPTRRLSSVATASAAGACATRACSNRARSDAGSGRGPPRAASSRSSSSMFVSMVVLQLAAEAVAGPLEEGLDLDAAAPQLGRDLLHREPVQVLEHQHLAVQDGKAPQSGHHLVAPVDGVEGLVLDRFVPVLTRHRDQPAVRHLPAPLHPVVAGDAVAGDGAQPGAQGCVPFEAGRRPHRLQEGLLHQILGHLLVATDPGQDEAVDNGTGGVDEGADGGGLAGSGGRQQPDLARVPLARRPHRPSTCTRVIDRTHLAGWCAVAR